MDGDPAVSRAEVGHGLDARYAPADGDADPAIPHQHCADDDRAAVVAGDDRGEDSKPAGPAVRDRAAVGRHAAFAVSVGVQQSHDGGDGADDCDLGNRPDSSRGSPEVGLRLGGGGVRVLCLQRVTIGGICRAGVSAVVEPGAATDVGPDGGGVLRSDCDVLMDELRRDGRAQAVLLLLWDGEVQLHPRGSPELLDEPPGDRRQPGRVLGVPAALYGRAPRLVLADAGVPVDAGRVGRAEDSRGRGQYRTLGVPDRLGLGHRVRVLSAEDRELQLRGRQRGLAVDAVAGPGVGVGDAARDRGDREEPLRASGPVRDTGVVGRLRVVPQRWPVEAVLAVHLHG